MTIFVSEQALLPILGAYIKCQENWNENNMYIQMFKFKNVLITIIHNILTQILK